MTNNKVQPRTNKNTFSSMITDMQEKQKSNRLLEKLPSPEKNKKATSKGKVYTGLNKLNICFDHVDVEPKTEVTAHLIPPLRTL